MIDAAVQRPFPKFAPFVRRAKTPAGPCRECGAAGQHADELLHQTLLAGAALPAPVLMLSHYPLCPACARDAGLLGWPALARVWRDLAAAPHALVGMVEARPQGGMQ